MNYKSVNINGKFSLEFDNEKLRQLGYDSKNHKTWKSFVNTYLNDLLTDIFEDKVINCCKQRSSSNLEYTYEFELNRVYLLKNQENDSVIRLMPVVVSNYSDYENGITKDWLGFINLDNGINYNNFMSLDWRYSNFGGNKVMVKFPNEIEIELEKNENNIPENLRFRDIDEGSIFKFDNFAMVESDKGIVHGRGYVKRGDYAVEIDSYELIKILNNPIIA